MNDYLSIIPIVTDDKITLYVVSQYTLIYTYNIIKHTLAYRPVAISKEEAYKLDLTQKDYMGEGMNTEFIRVTDVNGNSFLVQLTSVTYMGTL